ASDRRGGDVPFGPTDDRLGLFELHPSRVRALVTADPISDPLRATRRRRPDLELVVLLPGRVLLYQAPDLGLDRAEARGDGGAHRGASREGTYGVDRHDGRPRQKGAELLPRGHARALRAGVRERPLRSDQSAD